MITIAGAAAFLSSARFLAAIKALAAVLLLGIAVLLVFIIGYQISIDARARRREHLRRRVREAVGRVVAAENEEAAAKINIPERTSLFNRQGMGILLHVFEGMNESARAALRGMLLRIGYGNYVKKQLGTDNEDFLIEVVRMVADLDLTELDGKVSELLYVHKDNVELQYQAFLTLSRLGSGEPLTRVCMDKDFVQTLSFRSLQQILLSYRGDKPQLYAQLLSAPDKYVVRVCIKRIGAEGVLALAPEVEHWLDSDDANLTIDAIRTLGLLRYQPAAGRIATFLKHERWEVRSVAVTALAAIDLPGHQDELVAALQDREWQVRYNAGTALRASANKEELRRKVLATGDRYALEMLDYMMQTAEMWRSA